MKLICINTETSGFDPNTGEILELSYQTWEDFKRGPLSLDTFRAVGNIGSDAFKAAAAHNGYNDEARVNCATLRAGFIARTFEAIDACDGNVLVRTWSGGVSAWSFVAAAARRFGVPQPKFVRLLDVGALALPMLAAGKVTGLGLDELGKLVAKPTDPTSKAGLTIDVFEALCKAYVKALVSP